jgi:uncharacterized membrane protein YbhN (UPF0104 family)
VNLADAAAAVLLCRLFPVIVPALLGAPALVILRRKLTCASQTSAHLRPLARGVAELS